ncbi:MAG: helix-turn-helix domain-containing protein [candidate division Zixibacteria bacterium]|nr:helix-turn-helix domain-containing protein [candidate division Zixibacteria bacterium]
MPEKSLGDVLKSLREEQNLSRDQLYSRTKILVKYIEALENGRWDLLPGQVYLKPFIKSIAEALDADYNELSAMIDKSDMESAPIDEGKMDGKKFDYRWPAIVVMVVLAALVIFMLRPVETPEVDLEGDSTTAVVVPEENNAIYNRQYSSELDINKSIVEPEEIHTLEITATDSVWLMLTAGDDTSYVGVLSPGRKIIRQSTRLFKLAMGRVNCLDVIYDSVAVDNDKYLRDKRRLDLSEIVNIAKNAIED